MSDNQSKKLYYVNDNTLTLSSLREAICAMLCRDFASSYAPVNGEDKTASQPVIMAAIAKEVAHFSHRQVHDFQIRSLPIPLYGNALRHFYLRVNDIVEVHPGEQERISLRGWHEGTDLGCDRLERRFMLCARCADRCLAACWNETKGFNLIFSNCDQSLNGAKQSAAVAGFIALFTGALTCVVLSAARRVVALLLLLALCLFAFVQCQLSSVNQALGLPGVVEPVLPSALQVTCCLHVCQDRAPSQPAAKST